MAVISLGSMYDPERIDSADVLAYPSLKGYWKCLDGGSVVRDSSMYGNHLQLELSGYGMAAGAIWTNKPGYMSIKNHDRARIAITPSLNLAGKVLVLSVDIEQQNVLSDVDLGSAWNSHGIDVIANPTVPQYQGFGLAPIGDVMGVRVSKLTPGAGNWAASNNNLTMSEAVTTGNPLLTPYGVAGAFIPSTRVSMSTSGKVATNTITAIDTIGAQGNTFALGAADLGLGAGGYTAIRNYQIWAFNTVPPFLEYTLRWLSLHPGDIPKWWKGVS